MRFYTAQHRHYCGIDLHARTMYVHILGQDETVLVEKNIRARPEPFLKLIEKPQASLIHVDPNLSGTTRNPRRLPVPLLMDRLRH